jgi:hypothetical protein
VTNGVERERSQVLKSAGAYIQSKCKTRDQNCGFISNEALSKGFAKDKSSTLEGLQSAKSNKKKQVVVVECANYI